MEEQDRKGQRDQVEEQDRKGQQDQVEQGHKDHKDLFQQFPIIQIIMFLLQLADLL